MDLFRNPKLSAAVSASPKTPRAPSDIVLDVSSGMALGDLPGARVLDRYAGSGQLGIEALSRGAARCVFLDEDVYKRQGLGGQWLVRTALQPSSFFSSWASSRWMLSGMA